ncbi:hypothetical protein CYY_007939 [Polysphondylium violaceum]|uniref:Uncharacterized protein n=1 Tax=Polysphondylium violaceum TaxID=133409 RepID=A0A8J4UXC7_9MYCE|nr:hypothetical protein CYY_007939 [Polysphondylium violaceum]
MNNKLSGIYQALESHNHKGALKLCNAILAKKKNDPLVMVLKAITLQKLNEIPEAIKTADQVAFSGQTHETILSNLNYFYKSVDQIEKMCKVYEISYKANPKDESLAKGTFLSYVKVRDFKQQQQVAIDLNKNFPKPLHNLWYLMTLLSMINKDPTNKLLVGLSQKMSEKLAAENKFTNSEELFMYETVLDIQGKVEEHLQLIKGKLGDLYTVPTERLKVLGALYTQLGHHADAAEAYKEIITKYEPDEWSCYMGYFDSIWAINNSPSYQDLSSLIKSIQSETSTGRPLRGPYIAEIEVLYRMITVTKQDSFYEQFKATIFEYFKRFGTKPIVYYDLKKYLSLVEKDTKEQKSAFLEEIFKLVSTDNTKPDRISQLCAYYKIQRSIGLQSNLSETEARAIIDVILQEYNTNKTLFPIQQSSERLPGDDLLLIAYFLLADLANANADRKLLCLVEAAAILEYGFASSPKNFQFNLYLMQIYNRLGAFQKAFHHFEVLNIKNIQWDTLGHLMMDHITRNPALFSETYKSFEKSFKFYVENDSTPDFVAECYKKGSFSKILEMQKFQDKVAKSHQKAVYSTERQMLAFLVFRHKNLTTPQKTQLDTVLPSDHDADITVEQFSFNQDLGVADTFHPSTYTTPAITTFGSTSLFLNQNEAGIDTQTLTNTLQYRRILLKLLVQVSNTATTLDQHTATQTLLKESIDKLSGKNQIDDLLFAFTLDIFTLYINILDLIKNTNGKDNIPELFKNIINRFNQVIKSIQDSFVYSNSTFVNPNSTRQITATLIEPLTWLSYLLSEINTLMPSKKAKKKEEHHVQLRNEYEALIQVVVDGCASIQLLITGKQLDQQLSITTDDQSTAKYYQFIGLDTAKPLSALLNTNNVVKSIQDDTRQCLSEISNYLTTMKSHFNQIK